MIRAAINPCGICYKNVNRNDILCSACNLYYHLKCNSISHIDYESNSIESNSNESNSNESNSNESNSNESNNALLLCIKYKIEYLACVFPFWLN